MSQDPDAAEAAAWHRRFAVDANNRAWALVEQETLSPAERDHLLNAAHASAHHWFAIGTQDQIALAQLLLGAVHARLGHGALAVPHARAAFDVLAAPGRAPWEVAIAHAVMAGAAAAAGDADGHARFGTRARTHIDALEDPEEKTIVEATFRRMPAPTHP
jgi:hypothetical protein